jgi:hypothetical protein
VFGLHTYCKQSVSTFDGSIESVTVFIYPPQRHRKISLLAADCNRLCRQGADGRKLEYLEMLSRKNADLKKEPRLFLK